jgi:hypothetical protein
MPAADCGTALRPTTLPIGDVEFAVFAANGSRVALCLDVGVFIVNLATGSVDPIVHRAVTARGGAFSSDGQRLVLVDYDEATLWFVTFEDSGRLQTRSLPCEDLVDVEVEVRCAVSPDGVSVAIANVDEGVQAVVWIAWSTLEVVTTAEADATYGLGFTPDSAYLVASGESRSVVLDRTGAVVSTMARLVAFAPDGRRVATVEDAAPAQLGVAPVRGADDRSRPRTFLPWGDPHDEVESVWWAPDGRSLAVGVGAWRTLDGLDEPIWRTDLVLVDPSGRRVATFAEPHGLDTGFVALHSVGFTPDAHRVLALAETLLREEDAEPVLAVHSFDARTGAWLGAIVALQNPAGVAASAGAALDPFGFQEGEGGMAPLLSGRRALGDASLDIDYGEVGSVIAAVTPDGWYGRLDGAVTVRGDLDPYDRRGVVGRWLLGHVAERRFDLPLAPPPEPEAVDVDALAQAEVEAALAGLRARPGAAATEAPAAPPRRGAPAWLWTAVGAAGTALAYWWWNR